MKGKDINPIIFKRVAITAGTAVVINFDVSGVRKWLVKNLTDGDVYFGTSQEKSEMILIPAGCAQIIDLSDAGPPFPSSFYVIGDSSSDKGVEVICQHY